jgi:hypothetical protein
MTTAIVVALRPDVMEIRGRPAQAVVGATMPTVTLREAGRAAMTADRTGETTTAAATTTVGPTTADHPARAPIGATTAARRVATSVATMPTAVLPGASTARGVAGSPAATTGPPVMGRAATVAARTPTAAAGLRPAHPATTVTATTGVARAIGMLPTAGPEARVVRVAGTSDRVRTGRVPRRDEPAMSGRGVGLRTGPTAVGRIRRVAPTGGTAVRIVPPS